MHPWHDISLGESAGNGLRAVVETPRDSRVPYGLDLRTGLLRVKRVLFSAVQYPANYGLVPRTLAEDEEPVDVLGMGQDPIHPLSVVRVRAVGLLRMVQGGGRDDTILAVHIDDPAVESSRECKQLPPSQLAELRSSSATIGRWSGWRYAPSDLAMHGEAMQHLAEGASAYAARMEHGRPSA